MQHGRVSNEGLVRGECTVPLHRRRQSGFICKGKNWMRTSSAAVEAECKHELRFHQC